MVGVGVGEGGRGGGQLCGSVLLCATRRPAGQIYGRQCCGHVECSGARPSTGSRGAVITQSSSPWCTAAANRTRGPVHKMLKRPSA